MDDDVQRLRREAAARPGDEEAARRLDRALERSGERAELRRRYRLKFECPLRFEALAPTADPLERDCRRCGRTVRHVRTPAELAERVAAGGCVSFARSLLDGAGDALAGDGRLHSAADAGRPCVVPTDLPFVDLDAEPPAADVLALVPASFARAYRVVPVTRTGDGLLVAFAADAPHVLHTLDDLRFMLNLEARQVLAAADAVERALARLDDDDGDHLMGVMVEAPSGA